MDLDHAYIAGMLSDSDLFYKLRLKLSLLHVCRRVHELRRGQRALLCAYVRVDVRRRGEAEGLSALLQGSVAGATV